MLSIIAWKCECGAKVKAMYDSDGAVRVQCPQPPCKIMHPVGGKITNLWIEEADNFWREIDAAGYIVS